MPIPVSNDIDFTSVTGAIVGTKTPFAAGQVKVLEIDWTSNAGGVVAATFSELNGLLFLVVTKPSAIDIPTDNYDITLIDPNGTDVLEAEGANRDDTNIEYLWPDQPVAYPLPFTTIRTYGPHVFNVANAGNTKKGKILFYVIEV